VRLRAPAVRHVVSAQKKKDQNTCGIPIRAEIIYTAFVLDDRRQIVEPQQSETFLIEPFSVPVLWVAASHQWQTCIAAAWTSSTELPHGAAFSTKLPPLPATKALASKQAERGTIREEGAASSCEQQQESLRLWLFASVGSELLHPGCLSEQDPEGSFGSCPQ